MTGFQLKEIWSKIIYCTKEQNMGSAAGATAVLGYPAILLGPWFLVSWFFPVVSWLPGSSCFVCGCCSESEDSVNLLRIQHSNSLCDLVLFSCTLSSSQVTMHYTLSTIVCICTPCQGASSPVRQILFRGAMVPTLLPVRPGPHLIDVGLL